jgi:hypothetical protein
LGCGAVIADPAIIPDLWPEMIVAMDGPPKIVHSVEEILEHIRNN